MIKQIKKRFACSVASWLLPPPGEKVETRIVETRADGSLVTETVFESAQAARRYKLHLALWRNPVGRRALEWLAAQGEARS